MDILLATDGSRYALAASRTLTEWFHRPGAHVELLAVLPRAHRSAHRHYGQTRELTRQWKGTARSWLDETARPLKSHGFRVKETLRVGNPAEVVVSRAGKGSDLVVVGSKGRSAVPFFDIGSVALAVLEHAPTTVLMVRERRAGDRKRRVPTALHPLRVVLATDGGPASTRAARTFQELFVVHDAVTEVLAVADGETGGLVTELDARKVARGVAAILNAHGMTAEARVEEGRASSRILEAAGSADLLVLGSRGVRRLQERHLGSVALEVARSAPCTILVVRESVAKVGEEGEPRELVEPSAPVEIAYRNVEASPAVERHVLRGLSRLAAVEDRIVHCRIMIELRHPRHRKGNLYHVRIQLTVPDREIAVSRTPPKHREHETLWTAVGDAFDRARHELLEHAERERGQVKTHEAPPHGWISELFSDFGFIRSSDARIVYFHRNSVLEGDFDDLRLGEEVRFAEQMGDQGPQATTVHPVGKHHLVG